MSFGCKQRCEKLIIVLKIIGKLSGEDKLIFRHRDVIIQKKSIITSTLRYMFGDSRKETVDGLISTLDEIESIINDCTKVDTGMSDVEKYVMLRRLSRSLRAIIYRSGYGVSSLKGVYENDPVTIANLESITERTHLLDRELTKRTNVFRQSIDYQSSDQEEQSEHD